MPYPENKYLPDNIRNLLPPHAQDIYRKAFNNAWKEYKQPEKRKVERNREETAHAVAWNAVKKVYQKNTQGEWVRKNN